jgi:L-2-hydroxyglutarate oxidase LhgO
MADLEITVIGAGVVGLAIAARLSERHPRLAVLERNNKYGMETSSRSSEVIHAGIYYIPGSLRARLCVEGRDELYAVCARHDIAHRKITKIITAAHEGELAKLERIYRNGLANGVRLEMIDQAAAQKLEPNIRTVGALFSPETGILSVHQLMDHFHHETAAHGALVQTSTEVLGIEAKGSAYELAISERGARSRITSEIVINAAGLESDTVAAMTGIDLDAARYRLAWAKGSYFAVSSAKAGVVSRLVYPVPRDEALGVHALQDLGGRLRFGPDLEYLEERKADYRVDESKRDAFGAAIRHIVPSITDEDITPDMSGIRPKLQRSGEPVHDFVIVEERDRGLPRFINLIGIDSPGLTASPAIARYVEGLVDRLS